VGLPEVSLSPLERQLLANFEAHRDLVNACLAEELAQARFTQERIGQTTREYLQQCLDLQERITQQLREDIEDIAPEKNNPKEV
jgi:DNA-binding FadR family transcriptional regulator